MKKILAIGLCLLFAGIVHAQLQDPVKWRFAAKKINAATYEVYLTATMEAGWRLYSQSTPKGGPVPTSISFAKNPLLRVVGTAKEVGKPEEKFEELFGVNVRQFSNKVDFVQTVNVTGKAKTALNGTVTFMACNDKECLPPKTQKFSVLLN